MRKLTIDLETRSDVDITKSGVYRYADSPYFDILLFAYSVDDAPVQVIDLACGEQISDEILHALVDDSVMKHSFNAAFERVCLSVWLSRNHPEVFRSYSIDEDTAHDYLDPTAWRCSMVASAYLGLPLTLAGVGSVLKLEEQKMSEGKVLIRYFSVPCGYEDGVPLFHSPDDAPDKWAVFKAYNKRDVETEMGIEAKISRFPVPDFVWEEYILDQEINDRGIRIDLPLVRNAIQIGDAAKERLTAQLQEMTGLENPNSVQQMKDWLKERGVVAESLEKKDVQELLKTVSPEIREVLLLRQQTSRSSVKKYTAMQKAVCSDGRARGMFQFYGANRTGREAGRIIQLQNLPQNHIPDLAEARSLLLSSDIDALNLLYEDIPDTLSQLVRTAFIPRQGYKFIVADFSAIEARVIAWLAGETWRMQAFANGEDIYCASQKRIVYMPTNSFYQVLSAEAYSKHGFNIHGVVFDELHTQPNRKLFDVMTKGSGDARMQPLYFLITTAGTDTNSICYEQHQKAKDILEGRKIDRTFYPVIYGAEDDADWTSPKVWKQANPSLGETIGMEKIVAACESARQNPGEENAFRQLRLNQWVKQAVRWMPMEKWDACNFVFDVSELEGRVCYGGLDLSSTTDITAFVLVFPPIDEDDKYYILPFFWLPEDTLPLRVRRDHVPYDVWERQGYLLTTEGNVVHYGFIENFIEELGQRFNIREIAFDRWGAVQMSQNLEGLGFTMVQFGQGYKDMSPPTKELMRLTLNKMIAHGGHPVLRWMMDNIFIKRDPAGNIKPDKEKSTEKIDGAVALIMALDRAVRCGNDTGDSIYDERELLVL